MSSFDDRQKGFEKKYAMDEELAFKTIARRNMIVGRWVAEKLGLTGDAAEAYAKALVLADVENPGDGDIMLRMLKDLGAKAVGITEKDIRIEMERATHLAREQLLGSAG